MRGALLRLALRAADLVAISLPRPVAYALADLVGRAWHRFAHERRALVTAQLARVSAATGRPTDERALRRLARDAFVAHARYYLEVLRIPHYSVERIGRMVIADDWDHWGPILREGAVVVTIHFGNFEPYGTFLAANGIHAVVPMEVLKPREVYEFMLARRATGRGVTLVPVEKSRRPMIAALRAGTMVALAGDRDLGGNGLPATLFGHSTTLPTGPAALALLTGRPLVAAACWRVGPERFRGHAWPVEAPLTGDRQQDVAALTDAMARRFEEAIEPMPEQWWATFQPLWPDLPERDAA
ncbi:MAG: hypothetical protein OEW24_00185 [Chloroflexota bacterium]|nr:hypothetical protein [Chloroflexota bacterium]